MQQHLCHHSQAHIHPALLQQHSIYASAFFPRSRATALVPLLLRRRIYTAPLTQQHLCCTYHAITV